MNSNDKQCLNNKIFTEDFIFRCLATCEKVINKNAYLEKCWKNCDEDAGYYRYNTERLQWMEYRKKLQSILKPYYSMKDIISKSKSSKNETSQRAVLKAVMLIESGDYRYDESNFYLE